MVVSLGSEHWHMSVNYIGRRVNKQRVEFEKRILLRTAKSKADYEDFAEDS